MRKLEQRLTPTKAESPSFSLKSQSSPTRYTQKFIVSPTIHLILSDNSARCVRLTFVGAIVSSTKDDSMIEAIKLSTFGDQITLGNKIKRM